MDDLEVLIQEKNQTLRSLINKGMSKEDAEDVFMESLYAFQEKRYYNPDFTPDANVKAFFKGIVKNKWMQWLKKKQKPTFPIFDDILEDTPEELENDHYLNLIQKVQDCIKQLEELFPLRYYAVEKYYLRGWSYLEIGKEHFVKKREIERISDEDIKQEKFRKAEVNARQNRQRGILFIRNCSQQNIKI